MWNPFGNNKQQPPPEVGLPANGPASMSPPGDASPTGGPTGIDSNGSTSGGFPPTGEPAPLDASARSVLHSRIAAVEMMGKVAVATITVTELTQDEGVEQLADLLLDLKETGAKHYVLDIQNIQFMDSMCLGCLVESLNAMASHGGRIALVNTAGSVQSLFRMTRLDRVFPICRDVMHAVEIFDRPAA